MCKLEDEWIIGLFIYSGFIKLEDGIAELQIFPQIFIQSLTISVPASLCWSCESCIKMYTALKIMLWEYFIPVQGLVEMLAMKQEGEMATFLETALFYQEG